MSTLYWSTAPSAPASAQGSPSISFSQESYVRMLMELLPRGPAFSREKDGAVRKVMQALADELARVNGRGVDLLNESDPRTATETIADWERVLSLPDDRVLVIPATIEERRVAVTQKYANRGGQNVDFFVALAAACGYSAIDVTLETPSPSQGISGTSGGSLPAGTYGYKVTAVGPHGESAPSAELVASIGGAFSSRIGVQWNAIDGATSYRVFGRTAGGPWGCIGSVTGAFFMDTGDVSPGEAPPAPGPNPLAYKAIELYTPKMLRVGFRAGARCYGTAYAYAMLINLQTPSGTALSQADFERVVRHATHAHIQVVFAYH